MKFNDNEVVIVGMGYVGLTLSVAMAMRGFRVHGVEIDNTKLDLMSAGESHFFEKGIDDELKKAVETGSITFSERVPKKARSTYVITVGTPLKEGTKEPRLDMISRVSEEISEVMDKESLLLLRSTVEVGTTRNVVIPIIEKRIKSPKVAFSSERTLEGKALEEIFTLPQVIGAIDDVTFTRAKSVFSKLTEKIVRVESIEAAEIIKLFDNSYRDSTFALGNELAIICEELGINGYEAIKAANFGYERTNIAIPGYVGGPCLEKDPYILASSLRKVNHVPQLVLTSRKLNEDLQKRIANRIVSWLEKNNIDISNSKISILGLAFKGYPETDDLRGAPSLLMLNELKNLGAKNIYGHDFLVPSFEMEELGITPSTIELAFDSSTVILFMNNNQKYSKIPLSRLISSTSRPCFFVDSWNMFNPEDVMIDGVDYSSIGINTDFFMENK